MTDEEIIEKYLEPHIEKINSSSEDNDILVEAISAINDKNQTYLFFSIQDKTKNRVNENISLTNCWKLEKDSASDLKLK